MSIRDEAALIRISGRRKGMRVLLGSRIYMCTVATHTNRSDLILLTTPNGVYVVKMDSVAEAEDCLKRLLKIGYYDFEGKEYSN